MMTNVKLTKSELILLLRLIIAGLLISLYMFYYWNILFELVTNHFWLKTRGLIQYDAPDFSSHSEIFMANMLGVLAIIYYWIFPKMNLTKYITIVIAVFLELIVFCGGFYFASLSGGGPNNIVFQMLDKLVWTFLILTLSLLVPKVQKQRIITTSVFIAYLVVTKYYPQQNILIIAWSYWLFPLVPMFYQFVNSGYRFQAKNENGNSAQ